MIYNTPDELPEDMRRELVEGLLILGRKLREWRSYADLHELRASLLAADGEVVLVCHHDDRVTLVEAGATLDLSPMLDGRA